MPRGQVAKQKKKYNKNMARGTPNKNTQGAITGTRYTSKRTYQEDSERLTTKVGREIVHNGKAYVIEYFIVPDGIQIIRIVNGGSEGRNKDGGSVVKDLQLIDKLLHRLVVTISVEKARKNQ